ncbi:protein MCM10 homolog [Corticium candelabrum]|uniref:protein MCM10 homolog n=1 Tax=Corticium candelabrum TaxID=121492 RepID=UPI002E26999F|nr:protein MCM10 homolog [Corticium candelabrum]
MCSMDDEDDDLDLLCFVANQEYDASIPSLPLGDVTPSDTSSNEEKSNRENKENENGMDFSDVAGMAAQMKKMQQKIEALEKKLDDKMLGKRQEQPPHVTLPQKSHSTTQQRPKQTARHTTHQPTSQPLLNTTTGQKQSSVAKLQEDESDVVTEFYSGLRLKNPLISPSAMREKMDGRQMVKLSRVAEGTLPSIVKDKDWVTIGVIINKLPPKETCKGDKFAAWKLSDLSSSSSVVMLFLFKDVYHTHWKTSQGQVIALLNPNKMQTKEGRETVAVSVDHPNKLMLLGMSKDLGVCQGRNKATNRQCQNHINKSQGDYCEFHVQAAYKRARANRMECQKGYGPTAKVKRDGNSRFTDGFFYGGQSFSFGSSDTKRSVSSQGGGTGGRGGRLSASSVAGVSEMMAESEEQGRRTRARRATGVTMMAKGSETFKKMLETQSVGARNFSKLHKHETETALPPAKRPKSATEIINEHKPRQSKKQATPSPLPPKPSQLHENPNWLNPKQTKSNTDKPIKETRQKQIEDSDSDDDFAYRQDDEITPNHGNKSKPVIGRGLNKDHHVFDLDLDVRQPTMNQRKNKAAEMAKKKAVDAIKRTGGIELDDANKSGRKKKKTVEKIEEIRRRAGDQSAQANSNAPESVDDTKMSVEPSDTIPTSQVKTSKSRLCLADFNIDINSEQGKSLITARSKHEGLLALAEQEREERYFHRLEEREKMEDKMRATMEIRVRVTSCIDCCYTAESAAQRCLDERHKTVKHKATKRFFSCKNCKQRTCTYDEKYPLKSCKNCANHNFEKKSMFIERKTSSEDKLLIRGLEHPKFMNSLR